MIKKCSSILALLFLMVLLSACSSTSKESTRAEVLREAKKHFSERYPQEDSPFDSRQAASTFRSKIIDH